MSHIFSSLVLSEGEEEDDMHHNAKDVATADDDNNNDKGNNNKATTPPKVKPVATAAIKTVMKKPTATTETMTLPTPSHLFAKSRACTKVIIYLKDLTDVCTFVVCCMLCTVNMGS